MRSQRTITRSDAEGISDCHPAVISGPRVRLPHHRPALQLSQSTEGVLAVGSRGRVRPSLGPVWADSSLGRMTSNPSSQAHTRFQSPTLGGTDDIGGRILDAKDPPSPIVTGLSPRACLWRVARSRSAVWSARRPVKAEVASSNLVRTAGFGLWSAPRRDGRCSKPPET